MTEFLETCDVGSQKKGLATKDEFELYHANLSASIEDDATFEALLRAVWGLGQGRLVLRTAAQKMVGNARVVRPRQRSPPPGARGAALLQPTAGRQIAQQTTDKASAVAKRREEILKMPQITALLPPRAVYEPQGVSQETGAFLSSLSPLLSASKPTATAAVFIKPGALSEAALTDDVKTLKVKATLAISQKNYFDAIALYGEALKQLTVFYGKDHTECVKMKESIAGCEEKQAKVAEDRRRAALLG